jgi:hypothetical protein
VKLFGDYLDRLRSTPDGDGSLLDHMLIMYGAGMSDSHAHKHTNLPILLLGGGAGRVKGGRHLSFPDNTPAANLLIAIMDKLEVPIERIGDSTGKLDIDAPGV